MGDFNAGPANQDLDIVALWEDNYKSILNEGFDTALSDNDLAPFCTLCPSVNPLQFNQSEDVFVDHIFVRQATASNPRRILDDPVSFPGPDDGPELDGFRSDHYGYQATVSFDY